MRVLKISIKYLIAISVILATVLTFFFQKPYPYAYAEENENPHIAEVIYNVLNYKNGEIKYTLQAWVNEDFILSRVASSQKGEIATEIKTKMETLRDYYIEQGLDSNYDEEQNLVETVIASFPSRHRMDVSDPEEDGYQPYDPFDGLQEWGFFKSVYSWTYESVFNDIGDTYIESAVDALLTVTQVNANNLVYIYNYGTSVSPKTINSNADNIYVNTKHNLYIHEYIMNEGDIGNTSISISQTVYNSLGWNSTLIAAVLLSLVTFFLVKRKKEKRKMEEENTTSSL